MLRRASGGIADNVGVRPGNRLPRSPTRDPQAGILGKLLAGATEPFEQMYAVSQGDYAPLGVEWVDGVGWVQSPEKAIPFAVGTAGLATAGSLTAPAVKNATGMGIRAYHGSPHDFDRFSMDKIGTGEGAQAYGHGLYFAENEGVARGYRDTLSGKINPYQRRDLDPAWIEAAKMMRQGGYSAEDTTSALRKAYPRATDEQVKLAVEAGDPGRMYEVDINASPDEFLDWDKPLSEQPESVQAAIGVTPEIRKALADHLQSGRKKTDYDPETWRLMRLADDNPMGSTLAGNKPETAEALRAAGIKGIRYKDAGSRGADAAGGTSNYVVFDDNIIDILKKYGIAGLTAGGAGAGILGSSTQDASASQPTYTTGGRFAAGGRTLTMAPGGIANAPKPAPGRGIAPPAPFMPGEERQLSHGLIKSDVPGRTDQLPITVPTDSYIIPADVISGLGQGNSDAGWPIFRQILAARGVSVPDDGSYDDGPGVDIIAAGGEGVVHPEVIRALGGGDMKKGHRILDDMVLSVRKQTAKRLSKLPGPKK